MRRAGAVLLLLLAAPAARAGERALPYGLWCGARAADLGSTELALARVPGAFEANPLLRERGVRLGLGAATCVGMAEVDHSLRGRRKTRWAVRLVGLGLWGYAVQHNLRLAGRQGRP